jgi:Tol biopolymer transport system component
LRALALRYNLPVQTFVRRAVFLSVLVLLAAAVVVFVRRVKPGSDTSPIAWVATAHQYGPVGYRDPAAAISPDARWIAYSEGRFLRVRAIGGGPVTEFPPAAAQIRHLSWRADNKTVLAGGDLYDRVAGTRTALWPTRTDLLAHDGPVAATVSKGDLLRQAVWSRDGEALAALVSGRDGSQLWTVSADGGSAHVHLLKARATSPAWTPRGEVGCIAAVAGRLRITIPCGSGTPVRFTPDLDAYGPLAFSPDGAVAYVGLPNSGGTLDLWAVPTDGGSARRLTAFSRDTYGPSVGNDGTVLFKSQSYRTAVAAAATDGSALRTLATFQSETPSWDPTGRWIGITYGTWRRVVDDANYPDIAQEVGIIAAGSEQPSTSPARVVHDSSSEDQSMCWSPNGKWIAFHSHKEQSDDVWLRSADGTAPVRRISMLGRGAETGWPRWSPDGRWVLFEGASRQTKRSVLYVIGVDQRSGDVTADAAEVPVSGIDAEIGHGEWLPDSTQIVVEATEAPGRHMIFTVPRTGGGARVVHRFASEHEHPGLGISPDGREAAFIAPDAAGFFQIFRLPLDGGQPRPITTDHSHKTQPAWSPDGRRLAFTVWEYNAQLWVIRP